MCDGFSAAFLAAGIGASEVGVADAAVVGGETVAANAGAYAGMAASVAGSAGGAASLASAGLSAYSQYAQSNAAKQSAQFQSSVDANNAQYAKLNESATIQAGQAQAMQSEQQAAQVLGSQRAGLAANGETLGSGSAVDLMASTRYLNAQDVNAIQSNAARSAWGYAVDASNSAGQSALDAWQAKNNNPAAIAGMSGASSLLGSATLYRLGSKTNLFNSFSNALT
jgi:hypothetical protein